MFWTFVLTYRLELSNCFTWNKDDPTQSGALFLGQFCHVNTRETWTYGNQPNTFWMWQRVNSHSVIFISVCCGLSMKREVGFTLQSEDKATKIVHPIIDCK